MTTLAPSEQQRKRKRSIKKSILDTIGGTSLLDLSTYSANPDVKILAKTEWQNPGRSVKDRPAAQIIRTALRHGELTSDKILLDSTSGNTGLAYAMLAAALGIKIRLTIPENVSDYQKKSITCI